MKNRDRYILKVNEYDMLVKMQETLWTEGCCVIDALIGKNYPCPDVPNYIFSYDTCKECIQKFLNEEE